MLIGGFLVLFIDTEVMQALLIISASAFALAALGWFSAWAFWIHPPEGWLGKPIVSVMPLPEQTRCDTHRGFGG